MNARSLLSAGALIAASIGAIGCLDEETLSAPEPQSCGMGTPHAFLISTLGFTRVDEEKGTVPGFDVDGIVSDGTDKDSCFKKDFVSPEGDVGIDNQIATFVPELEKVLGDAVDGLVQGAINNGDLLILLEVNGATNMREDECVDMVVSMGEGKPSLGTDGVIEAYQTYDRDPLGEVSHATHGKIADGELTIGPFELAIPIAIFDVAFTIHVHDALFKLQVDAEDGTLKQGVLGGGVVPQEILDGVKEGAGVAQYLPVLTIVLEQSRDLARDESGVCQQISAAFQISAVEAFVR